MATVRWGGSNGSWLFPTFWRPLAVPGAPDTALFGAGDFGNATIDGPATITDVVLQAGSHASVLVDDALTVLGRFVAAGGTVELDQGGTISGGTIDLTQASLVADGGVIDQAVWIGDFGRGVIVTDSTLSLTEAARQGAAMAVAGTLGLAGGSYDGVVLSLQAFGAAQAPELDVTNDDVVVLGAATRVVLSQDDPSHAPGSLPGGAAPTLGGTGTISNQGLLISDALDATIDPTSFVNAASLVLNDAVVANETQYFFSVGLLTWTATLAPTLTLNTAFENDGTISGAGATIEVVGGSFDNTGTIDLGSATAQGPILLPHPSIGAIQLLSTLDIAAAVGSFSNTGTLAADRIELDGPVSLGQLGTLLGTVMIAGTLDLQGGTLDSTTLAAGTTYVLSGTVVNGTILDIDGRIDTSAASLDGVSTFYTQPTTLFDVLGPGSVVLSEATSELSYSIPTNVQGLTVTAGVHGLYDRIAVRGGSVTFGADTLISDTVVGTTLQIGGGGVFIENGQIDLDGSSLEIATLDGSGTITLSDSAVLTIDSIAATAALTIVFGGGTNALILPGDASGLGQLGLTVSGLAAGDLLDFTGVSSDPGTVFAQPGAGLDGSVLQVQGASGDQASIDTDSTGLTFDAATDPDGGTIVTVACFRHGTRIATPSGEIPVEQLRIGDLVRTQAGAARPIKWLGRRAYPRALVRRQRQLRPVRIAAGALGGGLPRRPLDVSPLHALLLGGVLVPAASLLNGRTITRAPIADTAYVHVELDSPDILLAEGAPTESFVDCDSLAMFANAGEFARLYPDHPWRDPAFPAPRIEEGWRLEALRWRLRGAAPRQGRPGPLHGHIDVLRPDRIEGWALDAARPRRSAEFEIVAGGRQIDCLVANRYRIDLDRAGYGDGSCGFTAALPDLGPAALASLALVRLSDGARLTG